MGLEIVVPDLDHVNSHVYLGKRPDISWRMTANYRLTNNLVPPIHTSVSRITFLMKQMI